MSARHVTDAAYPDARHGPMLGMTCSTCHADGDLDSLRVLDGRFIHADCEPETPDSEAVDRIYPRTSQARSIEDDSR